VRRRRLRRHRELGAPPRVSRLAADLSDCGVVAHRRQATDAGRQCHKPFSFCLSRYW
jgi:hypothetical protein